MALRITTICHYAECHYAECRKCHRADICCIECHYADSCYTVMLSVIILNVVMVNVVMLNVVAPLFGHSRKQIRQLSHPRQT
jgi:hypothetical protein